MICTISTVDLHRGIQFKGVQFSGEMVSPKATQRATFHKAAVGAPRCGFWLRLYEAPQRWLVDMNPRLNDAHLNNSPPSVLHGVDRQEGVAEPPTAQARKGLRGEV